MHPDHRERIWKKWQDLLARRESFEDEYPILAASGETRWVWERGRGIFADDGRLLFLEGFIADITDRKRAEQALAHSHNLMRYIIEHNRSAVAVHDRDLRYIFVSQRYLDEYKVKEKDVIGRHHYEVFPDLPQKWRDVHQRALAGEVCSAEDDPYYREDGTVEWTRWECRPWYQVDGSIGGIIIYTEVVTDRKRAEIEREAAIHILNLINTDIDMHQLMKDVAGYFQIQFDFQAVGIRLRDGEDFPYFETRGFPEDFVQLENRLCAEDENGEILRDSAGNPYIECMCGNILRGRTDPSKPFFTPHGSFWSNCTTELLASTSDAERQTRTRNRCNGEGYESVALIPLRSGKDIFGLIQLNDKRRNKFTPELIALFERLADSIASGMAERRAQEALRVSEDKFSKIFRLSPEMVAITRISDGVYLDINDTFEKVMRYSRQETIGHSSMELGIWIELEDRDRMIRMLRENGSVHQQEMRFRRKDQQILTALFSATPVEIHGERVLLSLVVDITERKKAEQQLLEWQATLDGIYRAAPVGIGMVTNRVFTQLNDRLCELTGYTRQELIGKSSRILYPSQEEFDKVGRDKYADIRKAGIGTINTRWQRKDGAILDILLSSAPLNPADYAAGVVFTAMDITELQKIQEALRESEDRFRNVVKSSPMGMHLYEVNPAGELILIDANASADRFTGTQNDKLLGLPILEAFPGLIGTDIPGRYADVALGKAPAFEMRDLRYDDPRIHGIFDIYIFQSSPGRMVAMFQEVTERKLAELQRERLLKDLQAKTEELESIIYVSSHDLRSPLVNIQGFSGELGESCRQIQKLLSTKPAAESDHRQLEELLNQDIPSALEYITTSVSKLDSLQKGLLKICRIGRETLEIAPVSMDKLIDSILKSTRFQLDGCNARVTVDPLPDCRADAGQLTQVFTNLIDNAIKYRSPDRPLSIRIYGRAEGSRCVYAVADNGVGIAPEHQQKVFEMFHQLDPLNGPGGEGLGLTIVKRILGRMDGQVRLESALGVGSIFFVTLPKA